MNSESKGRVLLLDDDEAITMLFGAELTRVGWKVTAAEKPNVAFKFMTQIKFDFVIVDINLNCGVDGFQFVRSLRMNQKFENMPVIFLTAGSNSDHDVTRAKFLRASDFVLKPITPANFVARIQEVVG